MTLRLLAGAIAMAALLSPPAFAQSDTNLAALHGLAPLVALPNTATGRAALGANYTVTAGIQSGSLHQPTLLPFAEQQQQALRDAFITHGNLVDLTDGLGTTLGAAYEARAHYSDSTHYTNISPAVHQLIAYALTIAGSDAKAAKFFFANGTTDGTTAASDAAASILKGMQATPDVFGRAYRLPAGSAGANKLGDSRPFQTIPHIATIQGPDYFNDLSDNTTYNQGPVMDLTDSPSFPSGHTTYGYTGGLLLALLVPDRYQEMITRAAEYGNDRIILGAHYAMDVLGGRTLALHDMAHLLANDPDYVNQPMKGNAATIKDFRNAVAMARADLSHVLATSCGNTIAACAADDHGRFNNAGNNAAFYAATQTYGLPVVFPARANATEDVHVLAPEAGYLLTVAFPSLSLDEADQILTETEGPGGGFLDNGSEFGVYSRLNLYAAAGEAAALVAAKNAPSAPAPLLPALPAVKPDTSKTPSP
ncbi:phosphatase PAP2 family protein [Acidisoma sp. 7E03]